MPTSTGKTGRGVFIEIADALSPQGWVTIGNVTSLNPTGQDADEIDFTHLLSTGGYRELQQGFKDAGSVGINYHLDPTDAVQAQILADFASGRTFDARISFVGAGWNRMMLFQGFWKNPGDIDINVDGPISSAGTIRRTGPTTFISP